MRWDVVVGNLGSILKLFGLAFLVPVIPALWYWEEPLLGGVFPYTAVIFLCMVGMTTMMGLIMEHFGMAEDFHHNEAILVVSSAWLLLAWIAALPFLFTGTLHSPIDAFFESMSGMTTTGSTILAYPLEQYHKSVILWRGLLQWLGGMGVIVLSVAILSKLTSGGLSLLEAESPGPTITRLKPKIKETAKILWYIYALITLAEVVLLMIMGVSLYDAVSHAFTTIATGGFSPYSDSIAFFSPGVQWIITVFMILAGTNFSLYYQFGKGNFKKVINNVEYRTYLLIIGTFSTVVAAVLIRTGMSVGEAARHGMFQIVSLMTTTGYATIDFDQWPDIARILLLLVMFIGGSAGSTGGGIKVLRIRLLFSMFVRKFKQFLNPRRVMVVKLHDNVVAEKTLHTISVFFFAYILIFAFGTVVMVAYGLDIISGMGATAATLGNVGPGFGLVGPTSNYLTVPHTGRLILALFMWIGRLEIFTAVVLFDRRFYRQRRFINFIRFKR